MALARRHRPDIREARAADAAGGARPRAWPARSWRRVPLAVGRVHECPPIRARSDLVSEAGAQIGIARLRAGLDAPRSVVDEAAVRAALADVPDPELPMLSVV